MSFIVPPTGLTPPPGVTAGLELAAKLKGIAAIVTRVALGALGTVLIVLGLIMISKDLAISSAAKELGKQLGKAVKRGG